MWITLALIGLVLSIALLAWSLKYAIQDSWDQALITAVEIVDGKKGDNKRPIYSPGESRDLVLRKQRMSQFGKLFPRRFVVFYRNLFGSLNWIWSLVTLLIPIGTAYVMICDAANPNPVVVELISPDPTDGSQRYSFAYVEPISRPQDNLINQQGNPIQPPPASTDCGGGSLILIAGEPQTERSYKCYWRYRISGPAQSSDGQLYFARGAWVEAIIHNNNFTAPIRIKDIQIVLFNPPIPDPNTELGQFRYDWPPVLEENVPNPETFGLEAPLFTTALVRTTSSQLAGYVGWQFDRKPIYGSKYTLFSSPSADDLAQAVQSYMSLENDSFWTDNVITVLTITPRDSFSIRGKIWLQSPEVVHLGIRVVYEELKDTQEIQPWLQGIWKFMITHGWTLHPICDHGCQTNTTGKENAIKIVYAPTVEKSSVTQIPIGYTITDLAWRDSAGQLDPETTQTFFSGGISGPMLIAGGAYIMETQTIGDWKPYSNQFVMEGLNSGQKIDPFIDAPISLRILYGIDRWVSDPGYIAGPDLQRILEGVTLEVP